MEFGDLFSFDKKIAPAIIKPIYWIGLVGFFTGVWDMITSILFVIFGALGLRIGAEIALAIFEMHDKTVGGSSSQM